LIEINYAYPLLHFRSSPIGYFRCGASRQRWHPISSPPCQARFGTDTRLP